MSEAPVIRNAVTEDVPAIRDIYAAHVEHGAWSYDDAPPSLEEITRRYERIQHYNMPFLVAELGGRVVGFTYAAPYRPGRANYRYTVQDSIYLADGMAGKGIGRALLAALIRECAAKGYRQMVAFIGGIENQHSIRMHASQGFEQAGILKEVGHRNGKWVDNVIMQRRLGDP